MKTSCGTCFLWGLAYPGLDTVHIPHMPGIHISIHHSDVFVVGPGKSTGGPFRSSGGLLRRGGAELTLIGCAQVEYPNLS